MVDLPYTEAIRGIRPEATTDREGQAVVRSRDTSGKFVWKKIRLQAFYVEQFGAIGDGAADDTAAIQAAINAAVANQGGNVVLMQRHRITAGLTVFNVNNVNIVGHGDFNGGSSLLVDSPSAIDVVTFSTCQHCSIKRVWIAALRVYTTGWAIKVDSAGQMHISRVTIHNMASGIGIFRSILTTIRDLELAYLNGPYGIYGGGFAGGQTSEAVIITGHCVFNNPYATDVVGNGKTWATSTAYVVGNVVFANGNLYQCSATGTSASSGTGPSGIPSTDPVLARTTPIVDGTGTLRWKYAGPLNVWMCQDSYCNTWNVGQNVGALNGGYGFRMTDTANTGTSFPGTCRMFGTQFDHNYSRGVDLVAGVDARFYGLWVSSVLESNGFEIRSTFRLNWEINGGQFFGCSKIGILISKGTGTLTGAQIGNCSTLTANTFAGVQVDAGVSDFSIVGCVAGEMFGGGNQMRWGILVFTGPSNRYIIQGNRTPGNLLIGLEDDGTGVNKSVTGNV